MTIIDEVRPYLGQAIIFHTTIPPRKVPRLYVYDEVTETKDPVEFLWEHRVGYVALCGWKYSEVLLEQEHSRAMYLDFFEARRTRAWDRLSIYNPHLVIRGDTCCPSIAMADCVLAVMDWTLKRMFYAEKKKLGDDSIRASLRRIGIDGKPMFIGQPDLKKIVPLHEGHGGVRSSDFSSHLLHMHRKENPKV